MKTEVKDLGKCQVKLTVTLEEAEMQAIVKDVEKFFVQKAVLPGFRPGKAPIDIIRKQFAAELKAEKSERMVRKYYADAVKQAAIDDVALMSVDEANITGDNIGFVATVDVKPVFKLPTYKGLKIADADVTVKDDAVESALRQARMSYAKYENAKDGDTLAEGDYAQIDYSGTVGGKPILEIAPEAKVVAGGTGFWTRTDEGAFLKEIIAALIGMKAGETKEGIKAKFDKNAAPEGLGGKTAVYNVTLKTFRRRVLPTDAELLEREKDENGKPYETIEAFMAAIRKILEKNAVEQEAARRENEAIELLLKKSTFDVPASQVEQTRDRFLEQYAQRAQYAGISPEYIEKNRDEITKDATEKAERQVRVWYIIDAIAKAEKIAGEDNEIGKKVLDFILANTKK